MATGTLESPTEATGAVQLDDAFVRSELLICSEDPAYFIDRYCQLYDATAGQWVPFRLWPDQLQAVDTIREHPLVVLLKARQLGCTSFCLAIALWLMLFHPAATVLLFSRREEESIYLLGRERLRGMYKRLPAWMQVPETSPNAIKTWMLANGSVARAFPTNAGDSYTATLAIVDEADLVPDLDRLMRSVKPTIDGGGRMILLSRADKSKPQSEFKRIYRSADGTIWKSIFLPWSSHPERDAAWYERQRKDIVDRTGSVDDLHEQYPATAAEALAPRSLDKRIAPQWLLQCYQETAPQDQELLASQGYKGTADKKTHALSLPFLSIYKPPLKGRQYCMGADPAEGNPQSDNSALEVLDKETWEQVACFAGKFEPSVFAAHIDTVGRWYNNAPILIERQNHGHAVLLWLKDNSRLTVLLGHDHQKGWLTTTKAKAMMYDHCADAFRERETILHDFATFNELASVEGATLNAPEGEHDDRAIAYALAVVACLKGPGDARPPMIARPGPSYGG